MQETVWAQRDLLSDTRITFNQDHSIFIYSSGRKSVVKPPGVLFRVERGFLMAYAAATGATVYQDAITLFFSSSIVAGDFDESRWIVTINGVDILATSVERDSRAGATATNQTLRIFLPTTVQETDFSSCILSTGNRVGRRTSVREWRRPVRRGRRTMVDARVPKPGLWTWRMGAD